MRDNLLDKIPGKLPTAFDRIIKNGQNIGAREDVSFQSIIRLTIKKSL